MTVLHGGALGDLALALHTALRLRDPHHPEPLRLVSRVNPGDLRAARPGVERRSADAAGATWLHADRDDEPPAVLRELVRDQAVLNFLGSSGDVVERQLWKLRPARVCSIDVRPRPECDEQHITQQWLRDADMQGWREVACAYKRRAGGELRLADATSARGAQRLQTVGGGARVLVHPGSGSREKNWPLAAYGELSRAIGGLGVAWAWLLGPVERERFGAGEIAELRRSGPLIDCSEADELLELLAATRLYISNDSGPAHWAALVGTPTITLFGPTAARQWRPLGTASVALQGDPAAGDGRWGLSTERLADTIRRMAAGGAGNGAA